MFQVVHGSPAICLYLSLQSWPQPTTLLAQTTPSSCQFSSVPGGCQVGDDTQNYFCGGLGFEGKVIITEASQRELRWGHTSQGWAGDRPSKRPGVASPPRRAGLQQALCGWCFRSHQKSKTCKHAGSSQPGDVRNLQMNNKCGERKHRPNGLMFFTTVEGPNPLVSNHMAP